MSYQKSTSIMEKDTHEDAMLYRELQDDLQKSKLTWLQVISYGLLFLVIGLVSWNIAAKLTTNKINVDLNEMDVGVDDISVGVDDIAVGTAAVTTAVVTAAATTTAAAATTVTGTTAAPLTACPTTQITGLMQGPAMVATSKLDTASCQCGDTAICTGNKYCVQADYTNPKAKQICQDIPQCYQSQKLTTNKCQCNPSQQCDKDKYCVPNGTKNNSPYKCMDKNVCGGVGPADARKKLNEDCECRLEAGGTVSCAKDKYCWGTGCKDTPQDKCVVSKSKKIAADCACGVNHHSCPKGNYCYDSVCNTIPAHSDDCTANSDICLDSQSPCSFDMWSSKVGVSLNRCVQQKDDKKQYVKYTCVKDGELEMQKYEDKDCTKLDGKKSNYKQGECNVVTKYSWSGKCGGKSGVGSVATLLAFVLTALITLA